MLMMAKPIKYQSGDQCPNPQCHGGVLVIVQTRVDGEWRNRYLGCRKCGHRPDDNKIVVPAKYAPPRNKFPGGDYQ